MKYATKPATNATRFEITRTGDPFGSAWDVTEVIRFGDRVGVYRGDLSGLFASRDRLIRHLRTVAPGCRVRHGE